MQLEVGNIYEGKVTGITKFGAFVELEKGTTGMVHISEIANTYVSEIKDHIQEGQTVKVKILSMGDGKISLSIKKAQPAPERSERRPFNRQQNGDRRPQGGRNGGQRPDGARRAPRTERPEPVDFSKNPPPVYEQTTSGNADFEDMMAKFKASSEERFSDLKHVMENKRRGSSRRR
ncbi:S1 RNA binding domain protein [Ruminococcus sp. YE71]|uniref:S1 RNA-binding domain-containing protein n=1 Tax=unclassified Ruminococcus TaxID=2608920 RepID=UPI00089069E9|nr:MULTISPECIES: S1 RNA-binding domain-containing protein [unclassified Ruminococcus]SDA15370.1 S1 RNA binding domain protein [Ruminococcus sp. YE78]SFW22425.1 S1 RNA binding domain protein [Ruminococcus sp. YE71]